MIVRTSELILKSIWITLEVLYESHTAARTTDPQIPSNHHEHHRNLRIMVGT
jgi:hypothetical protein